MTCSKCGVYVKVFANAGKNEAGLCAHCHKVKTEYIKYLLAKAKAAGVNPVNPKCSHTQCSLQPLDETTFVRRCHQCGWSEVEKKGTGKNAPPSHYLKRRKSSNPFEPWKRQDWWGAVRPQNRTIAEKIIDGWNKDAVTLGLAIEYKVAPFELRCAKCKVRVSETYKDDLCFNCHINVKVTEMPIKKVKVIPLVNMKTVMSPKIVRKEGDIWRLPVVNSPMWTSQWAYQGSANEPYIVSRRTDGTVNGSVTEGGWACSCMNFTRNTPRTECKHILKVMMSEGITVTKAKGAMANVDDEQLKAFKAWQKEQAAAGVSVVKGEKEGKMKLFDSTRRKFR